MTLQSEMLADSPGGLWMCEGPAGAPTTSPDSSGNGNTLTENTSGRMAFATSIVPTVETQASDVDGAANSGYFAADANSLDLGDVFTLEAWIKLDSVSINQDMFYKELAYQLGVTSAGKVFLSRPSTQGLFVSTSSISTGTMYHLVGTKNGATLKMYLNGVDIPGTVTNSTCVNSANNLFVGCATATLDMMDGRIQAAAVYPTALSAGRVLVHYEAGAISVGNAIGRYTNPARMVGVGMMKYIQGTIGQQRTDLQTVFSLGTAIEPPTIRPLVAMQAVNRASTY